MRIAVLSDLHLVCQDDPFVEIHAKRPFFSKAWPSFKKICELIKRQSPDLVISLGDLVDWYSVENRDFAVSLMGELGVRWVVTPGNHDFSIYTANRDGSVGPHCPPWQGQELATAGWEQKGVELGNRVIDAGDVGLVLINSAISVVPDGTEQWLADVLSQHERNLVFTHVPLNIASVRDYIISVDSGRSLTKYVQSGSPLIFEDCLKGKVEAVFSGHLHFPGDIAVDGTRMHLLGLSIQTFGREYAGMGRAMIIDLDKSEPEIVSI